MNVTVEADRSLIRDAGRSTRYALLSFAAPEAPRSTERRPLNAAFVLDRSGSMGGSKIELARKALVAALRMLREADRFSVVSYDHKVDVVVPSTPANAEGLRNAIARVGEIQARGNTDLSGGWLSGCEQIAQHLALGQTTRCLLLTDGLANAGITEGSELARHAAELRARGITTSCFGIGADFDERLLAAIATAGGGHSYHIETAIQIGDYLTRELGEALETVAREVTVAVLGAHGVDVQTLNLYPVVRNADGNSSVQLGDLVSRQEVSLVLRLRFAAGSSGEAAKLAFAVRDRDAVFTEPARELAFTYAGHAQNDTQARNRTVDRAVAQLYAAAAKAEAVELNRAGHFPQAKERIERTARKIERYAGSDAELLAIVRRLREELEMFAHQMSPMMLKQAYHASYNTSRMREVDGSAKRRPTH